MTSVPRAGLPGTNFERTFIAIKPDGVQRGKVGNIIARFENKGYKLVAMKMMTPTKEKAAGHYADLAKKPFFQGLVDYFASGPIVAMVWEGINAIAQGRVLLGATNPADSLPGTIRGDLCVDIGRNICHGSDGPESAKKEIEFWFRDNEINNYTSHSNMWVYEKGAEVAAASAGGAAEKKQTKNQKKKSNKNKKKAAKKEEAPAAGGLDAKRVKACIKEGGKKGQDICGMSSFGVHYFLTAMDEPKGEMEYLKLCMEGANKEIDPNADDRKGGSGDLAKIFFAAGEKNLAMLCYMPKECAEKCSLEDFFEAVIKPTGAKFTKIDQFNASCEVKGNPEKGVFPLKLRDECIAAGFNFLKSKGLVLDDDSDDDINFADDCGIDLNAGADDEDY